MNIIKTLKNKSQTSPAINNKLYKLWLEKPLDLNQVEIILANYFARTINTVSRVCDVVCALIDPIRIIKDKRYNTAIIDNLENLQDELGSHYKTSHVILLAEWINTLLTKLGSNNVPIEDHYQKFLTEETILFNKMQKQLYKDDSIQTVVGASLAQELFADHMMKQIYEGYKNYNNLFNSPEEFERSCKYFMVHVDGTEEKHGDLIAEIVSLVCYNEQDEEKIWRSYNIFEEITYNFWNGIYNKLTPRLYNNYNSNI